MWEPLALSITAILLSSTHGHLAGNFSPITLSSRVDPHIGDREAELLAVAACTTSIAGLVDITDITAAASATGFFISSRLLLTAGHFLEHGVDKSGAVFSNLPGIPQVGDPFHLIATNKSHKMALEIVEWDPAMDIAILAVRGDYYSGPNVDFSLTEDFTAGLVADVIGYPARYDKRWFQTQHGFADSEVGAKFNQAMLMLPRGRLTVSSGIVEQTGTNPVYRLSTAPGMSGAPVFHKGKVVGIHFTYQALANNRDSLWLYWRTQPLSCSIHTTSEECYRTRLGVIPVAQLFYSK